MAVPVQEPVLDNLLRFLDTMPVLGAVLAGLAGLVVIAAAAWKKLFEPIWDKRWERKKEADKLQQEAELAIAKERKATEELKVAGAVQMDRTLGTHRDLLKDLQTSIVEQRKDHESFLKGLRAKFGLSDLDEDRDVTPKTG